MLDLVEQLSHQGGKTGCQREVSLFSRRKQTKQQHRCVLFSLTPVSTLRRSTVVCASQLLDKRFAGNVGPLIT